MSGINNYEIFAFDIETNGCYMDKNEIVAVGYVFGDNSGNISEKGRIGFKVTTDFEKRCYDEFYSKGDNMIIYNELQRDALPNKEATQKLADIIDKHEKVNELRLITDFAAYDPSWISYYFGKYINRKPLYYTHDNKFRPIFDIDSYSRGVLHMDYSNQWTDDQEIIKKYNLKITASKTHYPDDDAEHIYQLHIQLIQNLKQ